MQAMTIVVVVVVMLVLGVVIVLVVVMVPVVVTVAAKDRNNHHHFYLNAQPTNNHLRPLLQLPATLRLPYSQRTVLVNDPALSYRSPTGSIFPIGHNKRS